MTEWLTFVSDVGFPVVVTLYLLHRIEAKLDTVVTSIQKLPDEIKQSMS
ncbi:YvrJ family protein [Priestia megaterium]|nr:YvrJ family protein [Priestia megaterium]